MLVKGFDQMSDDELRMTMVALHARYEDSGDELYRELADKADEERARRLAAAPNPYKEDGDVEHAEPAQA
jgi:hypothetical protein